MFPEMQRGQTQKQHAVEAAYRSATGEPERYHVIAAKLWLGLSHRTSGEVQKEIHRQFGVRIARKTAWSWVSRGLDELNRRMQEAQPSPPPSEPLQVA